MQKIVSQLILISALIAPVFGAEVDFDRGVDLTDFIGSAVGQAPAIPLLPAVDVPSAKANSGKVCNINFNAPPLELRAGDKFAQASYRINERCEPELESVKYSKDVPAAETAETQQPSGRTSQTSAGPLRASQPGAYDVTRGTAHYYCKVNVWASSRGGKMVEVMNMTNWFTDVTPSGGGDHIIDYPVVQGVHIIYPSLPFVFVPVHPSPFTYWSWIGYYPYTGASTNAEQEFLCTALICEISPVIKLRAIAGLWGSGYCQGNFGVSGLFPADATVHIDTVHGPLP